jgi:hypothetical protein
MENKMMKPAQSADKIYNEFRDIILSDLTTQELIKKCAEHAAYIVYNTGPTTWEWEDYKNEKGNPMSRMINIKPDTTFWTDVRHELSKKQ